MTALALSPRDIDRLAAAADVGASTVRRQLGGLSLKPRTEARIATAAEQLGLKLPPLAFVAPAPKA